MTQFFLYQTLAIAIGFLMDFILGDPHCIPHPVCLIGRLIAALDKGLRGQNDPRRELRRGRLTVITVLALSAAVPGILALLCCRIHPLLYLAIESVFCWQVLAARQLQRESALVQTSLEAGNLPAARQAVSMIVGRDTQRLDAAGVARAAVETVAENASDGVIAPLCFLFLLGGTGGFFYKAGNTMDSMIGYDDSRYRLFGRCAAKTDDALNWLPARLAAWLMIAACPLCGLDGKNARRIFLRDRYHHASPNSAQTESVCAGALGLQLAGDTWYDGELCRKPTIGDPLREIVPDDIRQTNRLMYAAAFLALALFLGLRLLLWRTL